MPEGACVNAPGVSPVTVAALEYFGRWQVQAQPEAGTVPSANCPWLVRVTRIGTGVASAAEPDAQVWERIAQERRPTERDELTELYRLRPTALRQ
jgi:hypothetical protein